MLFTFCWFGEQAFNVKRQCGRRLNMERYHKVAIEVEAIDGLIGKENKSERTSDRD